MRFNPEEGWGPSKEEMDWSFEKRRELFREIQIAGNSDEEITEQAVFTQKESGLDVTSWKSNPDGTLTVMYENFRKINHSPDWMNELKGQQAS